MSRGGLKSPGDLSVASLGNFTNEDDDPCELIRQLGAGTAGYVDAVKLKSKPDQVYARKTVRLAPYNRLAKIGGLQEEANIIRSVAHRHVVEIQATYSMKTKFSLLMSPIADTDLKTFLEEVDSEDLGTKRDAMRERMKIWPGCLIRALNFLHEHRVKHRDIKPANILIHGKIILFTDFGLSKLVPEDVTTKTESYFGGTRFYHAPEVSGDDSIQKHGRAADVYALAIVLLEMATVLTAPPDSRVKFFSYRRRDDIDETASAPKDAQMAFGQWIWYLWSHQAHTGYSLREDERTDEKLRLALGTQICSMAFLALDPIAKYRITMPEMCFIINDSYPPRLLNDNSCSYCFRPTPRVDAGRANRALDPRHSSFKPRHQITWPFDPSTALTAEVAPDWESLKKEWLHEHVGWSSTWTISNWLPGRSSKVD